MRNPLAPHSQDVMSRSWAFRVNTVAASPLVSLATRQRLYRRFGLDIETDQVYPRCYFHSADLHVGPGALLNHGVHIENVARVEIGARTALGIFTTIITSDHEIGPPEERCGQWTRRPVTIGSGCWIGARALLMPGSTVGDGSIVAAGAVVRGTLEPNGLYAGVPARLVREL